jgi:hypothetical protein
VDPDSDPDPGILVFVYAQIRLFLDEKIFACATVDTTS